MIKRFLLLVFLLSTHFIWSQQIPKNHATELLLNADPKRVEHIIKFAHSKWGDDKDAIEYEVEKQSYCYIMIYALLQNPETSTTDQLIIRQEILRGAKDFNNDNFEDVDWFDVFRNINQKLKKE